MKIHFEIGVPVTFVYGHSRSIGSIRLVKAEKVLEINPDHEIFKALSAIQSDDDAVKEYASILYDEAMLLEGYEVKDRKEFVRKLNALMVKAFNK